MGELLMYPALLRGLILSKASWQQLLWLIDLRVDLYIFPPLWFICSYNRKQPPAWYVSTYLLHSMCCLSNFSSKNRLVSKLGNISKLGSVHLHFCLLPTTQCHHVYVHKNGLTNIHTEFTIAFSAHFEGKMSKKCVKFRLRCQLTCHQLLITKRPQTSAMFGPMVAGEYVHSWSISKYRYCLAS